MELRCKINCIAHIWLSYNVYPVLNKIGSAHLCHPVCLKYKCLNIFFYFFFGGGDRFYIALFSSDIYISHWGGASFFEDVPLVELCTLYWHACQVRVTVAELGLCCCVCVTSCERWLTPLCIDSWQYYKRQIQYHVLQFNTTPHYAFAAKRHNTHVLPILTVTRRARVVPQFRVHTAQSCVPS